MPAALLSLDDRVAVAGQLTPDDMAEIAAAGYVAGQILGKLWMVLLALPVVHWIRKREIANKTLVLQ